MYRLSTLAVAASLLLSGCQDALLDSNADTAGIAPLDAEASAESIPGCVTAPLRMLAWWKLDESSGTIANDYSGNSAPGTLTNGPTPMVGEVLQAYNFDGTNDYVTMPYKSTFDMTTSAFSVSAWVNQTAGKTSGVRTILDHRTSSRGYELFMYNGVPGLQLADSTGFTNYYSSTAAAASTGTWHFVVATVTPGSSVKLYLDGTQVYSATSGVKSGSFANSGVLTLAKLSASSSSYFGGGLDEVTLWSGALSAANVTAINAVATSGVCY